MAQLETELRGLLERGLVWFAGGPSSEEACRVREAFSPFPHNGSTDSWSSAGSEQESRFVVPFGIEELDRALPRGGLSAFDLHEWIALPPEANTARHFAVAPCTLLSMLTKEAVKTLSGPDISLEHFQKFLIWIGKECWPAPFLLENVLSSCDGQDGTSLLSRCIFVNPPNKNLHLQAIDAALRSPAVAVVVAEAPRLTFPQTRRFALAAKKHQTFALFVRDPRSTGSASAAATRWTIRPVKTNRLFPRWELSLLAQKGRQTSERRWLVELNDEVDAFRLQAPEARKRELRQPDLRRFGT